jgi:rhomboid family GlyGly-CTERM serine protease
MSNSQKKFRPTISNAAGRAPRASLLLTVAAVVIHLFFSLRVQLLYDRSALVHHELWRLLTCHWVHLSWDHLFWSALTFLGLGSLCEIMDQKKYVATVAVSALLIPAAIWWGQPDLVAYGGLSGLDCALYALLMVLLIKREIRSRNRLWVTCFSLLLTGLIAKITYETITGQTIFVSNNHSGMVPVPLAHLVGGVVGTGIGLVKDKAIAKRFNPQATCSGSMMIPIVRLSITSDPLRVRF